MPLLSGAYCTTTVSDVPGASVAAPALLITENGAFNWPTLTCRLPAPVSLIVILAVAVEPADAFRTRSLGETVR